MSEWLLSSFRMFHCVYTPPFAVHVTNQQEKKKEARWHKRHAPRLPIKTALCPFIPPPFWRHFPSYLIVYIICAYVYIHTEHKTRKRDSGSSPIRVNQFIWADSWCLKNPRAHQNALPSSVISRVTPTEYDRPPWTRMATSTNCFISAGREGLAAHTTSMMSITAYICAVCVVYVCLSIEHVAYHQPAILPRFWYSKLLYHVI